MEIIMLLFVFKEIYLADAYDKKILLVMTKGDGSNIHNLWNSQGGVNEFNDTMADWPIGDVISHGFYRSSVIDLWSYVNPIKVKLKGVNSHGDVLWWVSFSTIGTQLSLTSWFQTARMLNSSSRDLIDHPDPHIYFSYQNVSQIRFASGSDADMAWFYVDDSDQQTRPLFYLTRNVSSPQKITTDGSGHWWDDYVQKTLLYTGPEIQVDLSEFSDTGDSHVFLQRQVVGVWNGIFPSFLDYNIYHSMGACSSDFGTPYMEDPGQIKTFTTKVITYGIEIIAVRCLTIVILETIPSGATISFTGKTIDASFVEANALVLEGYWPKGTFPFEISTSTFAYASSNQESTNIIPTAVTSVDSIHTSMESIHTSVDSIHNIPSESIIVTPTAMESVESTHTISSENISINSTALMSKGVMLSASLEPISLIQTQVTSSYSTYMSVAIDTTPLESIDPLTVTGLAITTQLMTKSYATTTDLVTFNFETTTVSPQTTNTSPTIQTDTTAGHEVTVPGTCPCMCVTNNASTLTLEELELKLIWLRKELLVNYTTLSSHIRKLNSMPDDRLSVKSIGYMGVGVIATIIISIVFLDFKYLKEATSTLKHSFKGENPNSNYCIH